jgi:hypothetical protein
MENSLYNICPHNINMWRVEIDALLYLPKIQKVCVVIERNSDMKWATAELIDHLIAHHAQFYNRMRVLRLGISLVEFRDPALGITYFDFISKQSLPHLNLGREWDAVIDMTTFRDFVYRDQANPLALDRLLASIGGYNEIEEINNDIFETSYFGGNQGTQYF